MKYYEILYIVNPNLEQPRLKEVKKEVADEATKLLSAAIINHRIFGKKRLAYPIDKHKYGTYMLLHLEAKDSTRLVELTTFFKLNKAVVRHLVVRLEERPEEDLTPEVENLEVKKPPAEKPVADKDTAAKDSEEVAAVETAEETPAEETPAEEAPAAEAAPVEETPAEDSPAEETAEEKVEDKS